jgi:hypothetical protein
MSSDRSRNAAEIFIDRVKEVLSLKRDEDLAARFRLGKSTIATWRRRGSIPYKKHSEIEREAGIKYIDILTDELRKKRVDVSNICHISYHNALAHLFHGAKSSDLNDLAFRISGQKDGIFATLHYKIEAEIDGDFSPENIVSVVRRAYEGEFLSPAEVLRAIEKGGVEVPQ